MYTPGKVVKAGSLTDKTGDPAHAKTYVIDMNQDSPAWRPVADMNFPRTYHVLTLLPDGTVLVTGGSRVKDRGVDANAVLEAEIWSPTLESWTIAAAAQVPRLYHESAVLLPDGRVLSAGSGFSVGGEPY